MRRLFFLVFLMPAFAFAQEGSKNSQAEERILSAAEFEAYTAGTTLFFNRGGRPYGAEEYLPDRKVIWTFLDGTCERGAWFNEEEQICFVYESDSASQCWHFLEAGGQKRARIIGDPPERDLYVVGQNTQPLSCPGPGVGVSYTPVIGN
ncbi:MAG: hypothetical protein OXC60_12020 [Litoreibacter sp.]|nr:hypothetical protein [Litoreibacter sp.]